MENKIHIVLVYYKRPTIVRNALHSIQHSSYNNWILTVIDDSGDASFKQILESYDFGDNIINYVPILETDEYKINNGGSNHGKYINQVINDIQSDIVVILCDDDALHNTYLEYLNEYYKLNPTVNWAYCNVYFYDPEVETYYNSGNRTSSEYQNSNSTYELNHYTEPINPAGKIDSSQVSFKTKIFKTCGYPYPQNKNLDYDLFNSIYVNFGQCYPTFTYGQYKGAFKNQLGNRNQTHI